MNEPKIVVEKPKPTILNRLMMWGYLAVVVVGLPLGIYVTCDKTAEVQTFGEAYLQALRNQQLDKAYEMLTPETQAKYPREVFNDALSSDMLSRSEGQSWNVRSAGDLGCLQGTVSVNGESKFLILFMKKEGDRYKVHHVVFDESLFSTPWQCGKNY